MAWFVFICVIYVILYIKVWRRKNEIQLVIKIPTVTFLL